MGNSDTELRHQMATDLQLAVDAVYDAHAAHPRLRIAITNDPRYGDLLALTNAKLVADTHATHDGDWPLGSCDAELFHLEWLIHQYETIFPTKKPPADSRISKVIGRILTAPSRLRKSKRP